MHQTSRILTAAAAAALLAACSGNMSSLPTNTTPSAPSPSMRVPLNSPFVAYDEHGHASHLFLTRESMDKLRKNAGGQASTSGNLTYHGGPVQTTPKVVLVLWGMSASDPEATILQNFFSHVGGSPWQNTTHQYYQSPGAALCSSTSTSSYCAGNQTGQLLATVTDTSSVPRRPSQSNVASIASKWAATYGHGPQINYFVAIASGHDPSGFKTQWCAFHSSTGSGSSEVSYTDFPYSTDAGASCGEGFINSPGTYDGVTIVGGHEYAETVTDPEPNSGWLDSSGAENGDKCAWLKPPASNQTFNGSSFPVQGLWSNAVSGCAVSY